MALKDSITEAKDNYSFLSRLSRTKLIVALIGISYLASWAESSADLAFALNCLQLMAWVTIAYLASQGLVDASDKISQAIKYKADKENPPPTSTP